MAPTNSFLTNCQQITINRCGLVDLSLSLEQTAQGNCEHASNEIVDIPNDVQNQQQNYSPHFSFCDWRLLRRFYGTKSKRKIKTFKFNQKKNDSIELYSLWTQSLHCICFECHDKASIVDFITDEDFHTYYIDGSSSTQTHNRIIQPKKAKQVFFRPRESEFLFDLTIYETSFDLVCTCLAKNYSKNAKKIFKKIIETRNEHGNYWCIEKHGFDNLFRGAKFILWYFP